MHRLRALAVTGLMWAAASSTAYAEVRLSIENGRVSLTAKDATVRQILMEWARVGQTKIVNVERIPGGPVTLEFMNMPEDQALDLLLRSVSGYLAAPRPTMIANASRFDRVIVMPTVAAPRAPVAAAPTPQPTFNQRMAEDDANDERPNVPPNARGPLFNPFPQPQVVNPQQGGVAAVPGELPEAEAEQEAPSAPTSTPGTVSAPGMIVPLPTPSTQPRGRPDPRRPGAPFNQ